MKRISLKGALLITISVISLMAFAIQEKVIRVMKGEEILHELKASEFDYIEVGDFVQAPTGMNVDIANNAITIKWDKVDGASYNIYRSGDNVNFPLLASDLKDNIYVDDSPLTGTNYYKVKAIVNGSESSYTTTVGATFDSSENLESGIYLGINGFNETIYNYPIEYLDNSSYQNSLNFIDNLSINNGTLLYYSVDEALTALTSTQYPSDIKTVALVTFTDGLDQGSLMKMRGKYKDEMEYLEALNNRISNGTVHGVPITAYTIGLYGSNDPLKEWFTLNMQKLASSTENAFLVTNMAEVNAKFEEIAQQLNQRTDIQTVKIRMPGLADGRKVRFTFDNISNTYGKTQADMMRSKKYIEGSFNMDNYTLENVSYNGLTCESGSNIFGTVDGIYVEFTFKGIITDDRTILKKEYTDEWHYLPYVGASGWQYNSEFEKARDVEILVEKTSAAIMLNLDCSESLGNDFETIKKDAKDFINIIHNATSELPENPNPVTSVTLDVKNATDIKGNDIAEVPAEGTSYGTARHIELESFVIDGYTFTVAQPESDKAAKASYYYPMSTNPEGACTVRMYTGTKLTITAPTGTKMAQIEFAGSNGKADASKYTCDPRQLSGITATAQTWTYAAGTESVTISYEAQFRISTMTVTLEGGDVVDPTPVDPTPSTNGLNATFETGLDPWQNVTVEGNKDWYKTAYNSNGYAAMTGYKGTAPFDAWLISPAVDMSKLTNKILTFRTQVNGYGSTTSQLRVAILTDANPEACDPVYLNATFATAPESGYSEWVESGDLDLSAYTGTIYVGFQYTATEDANYATWCVDDVMLDASSTPVDPDPVDPDGKGTEANPYSCEEVLALFAENADYAATGKWVAGYIVGYIPGQNPDDAIFGDALDAESDPTNVLIADAADVTDVTNCVIVQLPKGSVREALNLKAGAANLGHTVAVYGDLAKYFRAAGVKNTSNYKLDITLGVEEITIDNNAPVEYFNLQGIRVANPTNGLYIRRQGNTATKVLVK